MSDSVVCGFRNWAWLANGVPMCQQVRLVHGMGHAVRCMSTKLDKDPLARLLQLKFPDVEAVKEALSKRKSWKHWKASVLHILKALAASDRKRHAHLAFMVLEVLRLEERPLDARKFTIGISACARANLWKEAISLLQSMPEAQVQGGQWTKCWTSEPTFVEIFYPDRFKPLITDLGLVGVSPVRLSRWHH